MRRVGCCAPRSRNWFHNPESFPDLAGSSPLVLQPTRFGGGIVALLEMADPIAVNDGNSSTMRPAVGPCRKGGLLARKLDGAQFPHEQRTFGVGRIEAFQIVDAFQCRFGEKEQFTNDASFAFDQSWIVAQIQQPSGRGRPTQRRRSTQSRGVGLVAAQGTVYEQVASRNVGREVVVVHRGKGKGCPWERPL